MPPAASQRPRVIALAGVINVRVRVVRANYFCWFSGPLFADVSYNIIRPMLYGRAGVPCKVIPLLERSFIGGLLVISTLFMRMCRRHSLKIKIFTISPILGLSYCKENLALSYPSAHIISFCLRWEKCHGGGWATLVEIPILHCLHTKHQGSNYKKKN